MDKIFTLTCIQCQHKNNRVIDAEDSTTPLLPKEGDALLCKYCGCIMILKNDLTVRFATELEQKEVLERIFS